MNRIISFPRRLRSPARVTVISGLPGCDVESVVRALESGAGKRRVSTVRDSSFDGSSDPDALVSECERIARAWASDAILAVAPPDADPGEIADAFYAAGDSAAVRLANLVTVVDARRFWENLASRESLGDCLRRNGIEASEISETDDVVDLFAHQIEYADHLLLTGSTILDADAFAEIGNALRLLQPRAGVIRAEDPSLAERLFAESAYDEVETEMGAGWRRVLEGDHPLGGWAYRRRRPFHPARLSALIDRWPESVLRCVGTVWIASRFDYAYAVGQVGPACFTFVPEGKWLATLPKAQLEAIRREDPELGARWNPWTGDRLAELAFLGADLDPVALEAELDACLVTDLELQGDLSSLPDPLPAFPAGSGEPRRAKLSLVR